MSYSTRDCMHMINHQVVVYGLYRQSLMSIAICEIFVVNNDTTHSHWVFMKNFPLENNPLALHGS